MRGEEGGDNIERYTGVQGKGWRERRKIEK